MVLIRKPHSEAVAEACWRVASTCALENTPLLLVCEGTFAMHAHIAMSLMQLVLHGHVLERLAPPRRAEVCVRGCFCVCVRAYVCACVREALAFCVSLPNARALCRSRSQARSGHESCVVFRSRVVSCFIEATLENS